MGMIPFKKIFVALSVISIVVGIMGETEGLNQGDLLIKSGLATLVLIFVCSLIRIPKNSRGTPLEQGMSGVSYRMLLKRKHL